MQLLQSREVTRSGIWLRRAAWLAVPALAVGAWYARQPAMHRYHLWKQDRAIRQAKAFLTAGDLDDAQVALRVALTEVPGRIEIYRVAADMLDQGGSAQAVRLRRQIALLPNATAEDRAALASCALKFRDFNTARDALAGMTPAEAATPAALAAALSFALQTNNAPVADALFDRLRALNPKNDDFRVAQAILHLRHPDAKAAVAARDELEAYSHDPKYALRIHREFLGDAIARRDLPAARRWAALALADPGAGFADRLQLANFEILVDKHPFQEVFDRLAPAAAAHPQDAVDFGRWLLAQRQAKQADLWLESLPPPIHQNILVQAVRAETAAQLQDWDKLVALLEDGAWGPTPRDAVRLAASARLVGSKGDAALRLQIWDEALQTGAGNLPALSVLVRLAGAWSLQAETEQSLWALARSFPDQTWAHQTLFNYYKAHADTANMRNVMALLRDNDRSVGRYQNDWALLRLLTDPTADWDEPKEVLHQLNQADPANPFYATGYAFALAQAGKGPQALALVEKLSPVERDYLPRTPYIAYVYGVNRRKPELERMEALAKGVALLPEERRLLAQAREALTAPPPKPAPASKPAAKS